MTDLEITRLCAEAMGYSHRRPKHQPHTQVWVTPPHDDQSLPSEFLYQPLHDDAQAMVLVKKFHMHISIWDELDGHEAGWWRVDAQDGSVTCRHADLNRAIVECVAKLKQGEDSK